MQIVVTCRALIIHEDKLLMCLHNEPGRAFYNLPGGKLETGETIEAGLERELYEETAVKARIGKLVFVNQLISSKDHRIEFFFLIENSSDFVNFDPSNASHRFEVSKFVLGDPTDPKFDLKPSFVANRFAEIVAKGDQLPTESVVSA